MRGGIALVNSSFKSRLMLWLIAPFIHVYMFWHWVVLRVLAGDAFKKRGLALNDRVEGVSGPTEARRLYLYSEADKMVDYRAIEAHAADAKAKGFDVKLEKFVGSPHVAHARADEKAYWGAVRELWDGNGGLG